MNNDALNTYTVTTEVTYFVQATDPFQARDIVYEALLGNGDNKTLGQGEVSGDMKVKYGFHSTISHGEANEG